MFERGEKILQYQVYLKAELGKLRELRWAQSCLEDVPRARLEMVGLPRDSARLAEFFETQEKVDSFVERLSEQQLRVLTDAFSTWRNNGVSARLQSSHPWTIEQIGVEAIHVQQAEAELNDLFCKHGYSLTELVQDPELFKHVPYSTWSKGDSVPYPVCLAIRMKPDRFRLFDGIHRAIQQHWDGAWTLRLCWADDPRNE